MREEIAYLPSNELSVALYFEFLLQNNWPYSTLESACYGIHWARRLLICRPMNCQLPFILNFCYKIIGHTLHLNLLVMACTGRTICMVFQALAIQN